MLKSDLRPCYKAIVSSLFPRSSKRLLSIRLSTVSQSTKSAWQFEALADSSSITVNLTGLDKYDEAYLQSIFVHEICHVLVGSDRDHDHIYLRKLYRCGRIAKKIGMTSLWKLIEKDVKHMVVNRDSIFKSDNFLELEIRKICKKNWTHDYLIEKLSQRIGVPVYNFFIIVRKRYFKNLVSYILSSKKMIKGKHMRMSKKDLWEFIKN